NASNPIESLSISQVTKIFAGDINNWRNLNGKDEKINLYVRDKKSGTYDSFQSIILKPYKTGMSETVAGEFENNAKLSAAVANDAQAIGFTSYKKVAGTKLLRIADNTGRVYEPNVFTIKTEVYPICRRLYLYRHPNATNRHAINFTRFASSETAQELIVKSGFVSPDLFLTSDADLPEDAPPLYRRLVSKAKRIPINIYFTPGSHQFDRDALVQLGEINRMLRQKGYVNRQVLLMGFSDASGSVPMQEELAILRARKVQQYLREYGNSRTRAFSFGSQMPLSNSFDYEGRRRNSRVEVWVR
ncbi:MAG: substrate-binding domain-containing protein, partial [Bacteroidota bacterium]